MYICLLIDLLVLCQFRHGENCEWDLKRTYYLVTMGITTIFRSQKVMKNDSYGFEYR